MFSTHKFEIKSIGNSICRIEFYNGADIDLSDAELINANLVKMAEGKKYCVLLDAHHQFTTTPESRAYVANKSSDRIAFAIVTSSIANKLVGNFFIQFNKPNTPTKLFSEEALAIDWLKEHVANYELTNT
jgi:hypothetical protein